MESRGRLARRVEEILKDRPAYGKILRFFQSVLEILEQEAETSEIPPEECLSKARHEGFPLRDRKDFQVDHATSLRVFRRLVALKPEGNEPLAKGLRRLKEAEEAMRLPLEDLVEAFLRDDWESIGRSAQEVDVDAETMKFVIAACIRPAVERERRWLEAFVDKEWSEGVCPICGSLPLLSQLRESEGKRYLVCSFCGHRWPTLRLGCPFCGTKDHIDLHYLKVEGQKALRVDLCEACKRYIKTLDLRDAADEPNSLLEDLASLHLDLLAQKDGYTKGTPDPWGVAQAQR